MNDAIFWGLIQGLTEFLPVSSSGHLVLVPEVLGRDGPDLATSALLHVGTLLAVVIYFRREVLQVLRFSPEGRRLLRFLVIGTIPISVVALLFRPTLEEINDAPWIVALFLIANGLVLITTRWIPVRTKHIEDGDDRDAATIGLGQAVALIPGISRSGATISTALTRGFTRAEAARYAFLLGIPAIAGAGLSQFIELAGEDGGIPSETWVGVGVAFVSGYAAIAIMLRLIDAIGLVPFGVYCVAAGGLALLWI